MKDMVLIFIKLGTLVKIILRKDVIVIKSINSARNNGN